MRIRYLAIGLGVALVMGGCRFNLANDATNNNATTTGGVTLPGGPTPTPTPNPVPVPTPTPVGGRTPDPPAGSVLPVPLYGAAVVSQVTVDASLSCTSWVFLDAVVDALRARDTRWGYLCASGGCSSVSQDKVAYHATAGPEVTGAIGVHVADVVQNVCTAPVKQYLPVGYVESGAWSSRGRF
jgi:hypothetical protein